MSVRMSVNARQFQRELDKEMRTTVEQHRLLTVACAATALNVAVRLCPVDTGGLRNSITVTTSPLPERKARRGRKVKGAVQGAPPSAKQTAAVLAAEQRLRPFGSLYLDVPLEHASYQEHGTPIMRAQPFVGPAVRTAQRLVR